MPNSAHIYDFPVATLPETSVEKSVGVDCCEEYYALASTTNASSEFNDVFLAVDRKASLTDSLTFTIKKCGGSTLTNLGTTVQFPQDDLAVGFIYDWRQYLSLPSGGGGIYIISKSYTFLGSTQEEEYARIKVWEYSETKARRTFRMNTYFDNKSNIQGQFIDFTGSNAYSSLRLKGKFGDWKAQTENKLLVDYAYNAEIPSSTNKNQFTLTVDPITYLFSNRLINMHLKAGTLHQVTDHNDNHRKYTDFEVQYLTETLNQEEPGIETIITADFVKYKQDDFSRYNKR